MNANMGFQLLSVFTVFDYLGLAVKILPKISNLENLQESNFFYKDLFLFGDLPQINLSRLGFS
jgi:hypothetical protein